MKHIMNGKQVVLFLLDNQDKELPKFEKRRYETDEWCYAKPSEWSIGDLLDSAYMFRIKPEKKPDIVCEGLFGHYENGYLCYHVSSPMKPNLRLIFDGETGVLKAAEVL